MLWLFYRPKNLQTRWTHFYRADEVKPALYRLFGFCRKNQFGPVRGFLAHAPEVRVDVREDVVPHFDLRELDFFRFRDRAVSFEDLPERFHQEKVAVVIREAHLGVITCCSGGDEELPVGGLQKKKLAAQLFHDA